MALTSNKKLKLYVYTFLQNVLLITLNLLKVYGFAFCFIQLLVSSTSKKRDYFKLMCCKGSISGQFCDNWILP